MFNFFRNTKDKKVFIFLGQEDADTTCGKLASAYEDGARNNGHEVRRTNIGDMKFDPLLHAGYKTIQELEPDLKKFQEDVKWADHVVIIYPTWWSAMPAILKGLFDRVWLPGFAFHFHKEDMFWDGLLKGKTARVVTTMDSWPLAERVMFGDSTNEITRAILKFAGVHPVHVWKVGMLKHATDAAKEKLFAKMRKLGSRAM
jgi:NAD(P)H dehydrogenase (quinone)